VFLRGFLTKKTQNSAGNGVHFIRRYLALRAMIDNRLLQESPKLDAGRWDGFAEPGRLTSALFARYFSIERAPVKVKL
jgi:hypothetical protein